MPRCLGVLVASQVLFFWWVLDPKVLPWSILAGLTTPPFLSGAFGKSRVK